MSTSSLHFKFSSNELISTVSLKLINEGDYRIYWKQDTSASYGIITNPSSGSIAAHSTSSITSYIDVVKRINQTNIPFYLSIIPDSDNLQCFSRVFISSTYELAGIFY